MNETTNSAQQDEREAGELEPCRWCNQTPRVADDTNLAIHVACKCGVQMWGHRSHFGSREEAIAAWNRRAAQQVQADAQRDEREAESWLMELCSAWDFGIPGAAFGDIVRRIAGATQVQADAAVGRTVAWATVLPSGKIHAMRVKREDADIRTAKWNDDKPLPPLATTKGLCFADDWRDLALEMTGFAQASDSLLAECVEALRDVTDDLDAELGARYSGYPMDNVRRIRDFAVVEKARAILARAAMSREQSGGRDRTATEGSKNG